MKNIKLFATVLGIVALFTITSCDDSNDSSQLRTTASINGDWSFVSPSSKGEFTVQDSVITKGTFTVQGITYSVMKSNKITSSRLLLEGSGDNNIALFKPVINSELTIITCTNLEYDTDSTPTTFRKETITITKK